LIGLVRWAFSRGATDPAPASVEVLERPVEQLREGWQVIHWLIKPEGLPTRGPDQVLEP
jgi:hypothetical protein